MRPAPIVAFALGALLAGCGGAQQQTERRLGELGTELKLLRDAVEGQNRRLEDMRDRLQLVEDQLEAQALHRGRVPQRLPVVRLAPRDEDPGPTAEEIAGATTITQDDLYALGGGARSPGGPVEPPPNAAHAGNIGVAPVPGGGGAPSAVAPAPLPPVDDAIAQYKAAYSAYQQGDLSAAAHGFGDFVARYPKHGYADNALFLLGDCRFQRAEYAGALEAFRTVLSEHPTGNKVPDALLMIGRTLQRLGRPAEGRETLARLVAMYPDTDAAQRAASALGGQGRM